MQAVLRSRLPPHMHLFNNILDVFGDGLPVHSELMREPTYEGKLRVISEQLPRVGSAWCVAHEQHCSLHTGASARIGGTPCQDFSKAGNLKGLEGPQLPALMAFERVEGRNAASGICGV